jgi:enoyl-CoA hydratase/carnithine racemase
MTASVKTETLSWSCEQGIIELELHRAPANEIGSQTLEDLESFVTALEELKADSSALIIYSSIAAGFSAGADLRELYHTGKSMDERDRITGVRRFLNRIHAVLNTIDELPLTTIAAVHGTTFGGGFELALVCDLIIADKMTRFCFPELRLGLIPGFGGIPRLKRDLGNAVVRDLLLTGRSVNASKAAQIGLVSQLVGEGKSLVAARSTARQILKFDRGTSAAAKRFVKPIPHAELREEIDLFCDLFSRPAVDAGLRRFVESDDPYPYLP